MAIFLIWLGFFLSVAVFLVLAPAIFGLPVVLLAFASALVFCTGFLVFCAVLFFFMANVVQDWYEQIMEVMRRRWLALK